MTLPKSRSAGTVAGIRRRAVPVTAQELVTSEPLDPRRSLPLLVRPTGPAVDLVGWVARERERLNEWLLEHGAVLFRGFPVRDVKAFEAVVRAAASDPLEYRERSSPREQVDGNVYTSTEYPASERIFFHCENSYAHTWPAKLFFYCDTPPAEGGETPIADCRGVLRRLSDRTRRRFAERGVLYVRNLGDDLGLSWQTVFQTDDRAAVDEHCRRGGYRAEWIGDRLRLSRVGPAVVRHPRSGEEIWFNHAAFFHVTTLSPAMRDALLAQLAEEDLPNNTYYGDGSPIEPEVVEEIRAAYEAESVLFPWQRGDVLALDNMLVAHARSPFTGPRRILVAMTDPLTREDLDQKTEEIE